jgi:kinetochor protein Mis14/NSL1
MQSEHRKIELQSPSDLTHLTSQIRTAARQKLDLHLPAQPSDAHTPDDLRRATESLVDAFVAQVLDGMRQNISINGIDVVTRARGGGFEDTDGNIDAMEEGIEGAETVVEGVEKEEFEAFDEKLRARLAEQVAKRDKLVASISRHRRETPAVAARRFEEVFEREMLGMERGTVVLEEESGSVGIEGLERGEEISGNWTRAVEGLQRLNKGLPETRARLERCGDVVGYLGADGK